MATALLRLMTAPGVGRPPPKKKKPSPNWPSLFTPQQLAVPPASSAQACPSPVAMATTLVRPLTATGVSRFVVIVPMPSWPRLLAPQHFAEPSASTAQVKNRPAATATALLMPLTTTGLEDGVVLPLPS